jgi:hypothetical protein
MKVIGFGNPVVCVKVRPLVSIGPFRFTPV